MSRLSKQDYIGISWGDLHLDDTKPSCRAESNWFDVMERHLSEITDLQQFLKVPIFCNGDIFNKWDPSPELINFAVNYMPSGCSAIPGNHDLYFHSLFNIEKTGYGVLAATGIIDNVLPRMKNSNVGIGLEAPITVRNSRDCFLRVYGFPYGLNVENHDYYKDDPATFGRSVAMIHAYVWEKERHKHHNAEDKGQLSNWKKKIRGYDFVLFGDNHTGFITGFKNKKNICNTGTFMRRTVKEIDYRPFVGLLRADGNIEKYELQAANRDQFHRRSKAKAIQKEKELRELMGNMLTLERKVVDFPEALKQTAKKYSRKVEKLVMKILSKVSNG